MKFKLIVDPDKEEEVVVTAHARSPLTDRLEQIVTQSAFSDRIAAYDEDEMLMLPLQQIECISVLDGKTYAIDTQNRRFRLKARLHELEEKLPAHFIRINKSAIANELRLKKFTPSFSGAVDAVFQCGHIEYVSRRCFAVIKRRYHL